MSLREQLIKSGWRQGALLSPEIDDRLTNGMLYKIPKGACLLIVSQTCDLIQDDMDREPYFEVLCLQPLASKPNKGYMGGKNSRQLEFTYYIEGFESQHWVVFPYERHLVDRKVLLDINPLAFLDEGLALSMVLKWLSMRYTRTAFPETFVAQIHDPKRRAPISRKFSRLNPYVSNIFIRLEPFSELTDDEEYEVELILLMKTEQYDDNEIRGACVQIKDELEEQLNKCDRIVVTDINIESSASLTFDELIGFKEWDYSYLSFREPDDSETPQQYAVPE